MQKIDVLKIGAIVPTSFLPFSISQGAASKCELSENKMPFSCIQNFKVYPGAGSGTIKSMLLRKIFRSKFQTGVIVMPMNLPTILTGAAVTAAVGTAAYMMTGKKKNTAKQLKKKAGKAVQAVGDYRGEYFQHHGLNSEGLAPLCSPQCGEHSSHTLRERALRPTPRVTLCGAGSPSTHLQALRESMALPCSAPG